MKLKNTYLDNLPHDINPKTGRLHGNFNQTGAETGRLSMSDPNLQNIPIRTDEGRRIRLAFVPGDAEKECAADGRLQPDRIARAGSFHPASRRW